MHASRLHFFEILWWVIQQWSSIFSDLEEGTKCWKKDFLMNWQLLHERFTTILSTQEYHIIGSRKVIKSVLCQIAFHFSLEKYTIFSKSYTNGQREVQLHWKDHNNYKYQVSSIPHHISHLPDYASHMLALLQKWVF